MIVFISGGCKNGKSTYAQRAAKVLHGGSGGLYYVATMIPHDDEDIARIKRHVSERDGWGFTTIECGRDIESVLDRADSGGTFLLDSVTALLSNEMFTADGFDPDAWKKVADGLCRLCDNLKNIVLVSDYIYSDAYRYDQYTEMYRRGLAMIDRALARRCDTVIEVCSGTLIKHKGVLPC